MTTVSVIIPIKNAGPHIEGCVASLLAQTFTDFEVILVDDGSEDDSLVRARAVIRGDERFTIVEGRAAGNAGAARNLGLDSAGGEYLAFLDADDLYLPRMLEEMVKMADRTAADVVICRNIDFSDDVPDVVLSQASFRADLAPGSPCFRPSEAPDFLFSLTTSTVWNKLFRRSKIVTSAIRFQEIRRSNDVVFTFCALATADRIAFVDEYLVRYRVGHQSLQRSTHLSPRDFALALYALDAELERLGVAELFRWSVRNFCISSSFRALTFSRRRDEYLAVHDEIKSGVGPRFNIDLMAQGGSLSDPRILEKWKARRLAWVMNGDARRDWRKSKREARLKRRRSKGDAGRLRY